MGIKKALHKISNSITKTILVMIVFFGVITLFMAVANKDKIRIDPEETTRQQRADIYTLINDPQYQKNDAGKAAIGVYRAMMCGSIGETCTDNPDDADENFNHSLFGFVSNLIVMPYANPPASGVQYIAYSLGNAGLIPKTYAAEGIGFASIKPMIEIWKAFRNVAYLILVLVLIAIGFMIMFRMKLNPQTVISLENSLPKIVISLILITFSFAIAGLLIDLMYVIIAGSISVLSDVKSLNLGNVNDLQNKYITSGMGQLWPPIWLNDAGFSITKIIPSFIRSTIEPLIAYFGLAFVASKIPAINTAIKGSKSLINFGALSFNVGNLPLLIVALAEVLIAWKWNGFFLGWIITVLLAFTFLFFMFRIFFMLLIAYLKSIILILFAPIFLLFEAIPGKNAFSFWIKSLMGELFTFPLVIIIILIGHALSKIALSKAEMFRPPFLYAVDQKSFASLLGLGIILILPNIVKAAKELLGIKGVPGLGLGAGVFLAGATTVGAGALGLLSQFGSLSLAVPGLRRWAGGKIPFLSNEAGKTREEASQLGGQSSNQQNQQP